MLRLEKVATPFTGVAVSVPASVPLAGLLLIAMDTAFVAVVTMLPEPSSMVTATAGVMDTPAPTFEGCTVNTNFVAVPAVTLNAELVALVRPVAVAASVYPVPTLLMLKDENVATPFTGVAVSVPASVPPAGLLLIAMVTALVAVVTMLPEPSSMVTATAGVMDTPAPTFEGCTVNTSLFAVPVGEVIVTVLGALTSPLLVTVSCTR